MSIPVVVSSSGGGSEIQTVSISSNPGLPNSTTSTISSSGGTVVVGQPPQSQQQPQQQQQSQSQTVQHHPAPPAYCNSSIPAGVNVSSNSQVSSMLSPTGDSAMANISSGTSTPNSQIKTEPVSNPSIVSPGPTSPIVTVNINQPQSSMSQLQNSSQAAMNNANNGSYYDTTGKKFIVCKKYFTFD